MAKALTFEVSGIDSLISRLAAIASKAQSQDDDSIGMRLGRIAETESKRGFDAAQYDGHNDVVVSAPYHYDKDTVAVDARGRSALFIEFGTGVHYSTPAHPLAIEYGFVRGGYGYHLGLLSEWRYEGDPGTNGKIIQTGPHAGEILTEGNPANMCMYEAGKTMKRNLKAVATEVFTK